MVTCSVRLSESPTPQLKCQLSNNIYLFALNETSANHFIAFQDVFPFKS